MRGKRRRQRKSQVNVMKGKEEPEICPTVAVGKTVTLRASQNHKIIIGFACVMLLASRSVLTSFPFKKPCQIRRRGALSMYFVFEIG